MGKSYLFTDLEFYTKKEKDTSGLTHFPRERGKLFFFFFFFLHFWAFHTKPRKKIRDQPLHKGVSLGKDHFFTDLDNSYHTKKKDLDMKTSSHIMESGKRIFCISSFPCQTKKHFWRPPSPQGSFLSLVRTVEIHR